MKEWQHFVAEQVRAQSDNEYICSADSIGLILVTGQDAKDFLQNQLSNDIQHLDESNFQISSYSTPKGRLLGVFRVVQISNGYLLVTAREMVLPLLQRLHHFIVQAQVNLADASDHFARIAIQSSNPQVIAHPLLPQAQDQTLQNDSVVALQLDQLNGQNRYLLFCLAAAEAIELWQGFCRDLPPTASSRWQFSEILAGIPTVYPATAESFVLQMANLGLLDGVSFKKGCYPGQEIVARMQYLGTLKRRMFLAQINTARLPQPGDQLVVKGKQVADGSGVIVDAAFDQDGLCHCLYIAQIGKAKAGDLILLAQPEALLTDLALPYSAEV